MRPVLTLFAAAATTLVLSSAVQAQQRYLTWPGKVDQPATPRAPAEPLAAPRMTAPAVQPIPAMATTPAAGDRYGPRRVPQAAYAPRPQPQPQPAAYVAPPAPLPVPAARVAPQSPPAPARASAPAPRRPTIYDTAPVAGAPGPRDQASAPRDAAMAPPAPEAAPVPPAPRAPASAAVSAQPWSAGRGEAQGTPSRRYSVQRETAENVWGPEVAARYGNGAAPATGPSGR